jgi:hypothetical protein
MVVEGWSGVDDAVNEINNNNNGKTGSAGARTGNGRAVYGRPAHLEKHGLA